MAGLGQAAVERLREFLRELKPGARALLIAELERTLLRGDDFGGAELILSELRRSHRDGTSRVRRIGDHARLFFRPIEPFLVDDVPDHRHRCRISRAALEPLWLWIANTVLPKEAAKFLAEVDAALQAGDRPAAERAAHLFQDRAVPPIREALAAAQRDDKSRRRIVSQLGTQRATDDVQTLLDVLASRDPFGLLGAQMPGHIKTLSGAQLEQVKALLDSPIAPKGDLFPLSLVFVMSRLAAAWQIVRLATRAAGSDAEVRIAETPYAPAVAIALGEIERMVDELASDLKSGRGVAVSIALKDVHDAVRGLRTELELPLESAWGRQLAAIRSRISSVLTAEIELTPGRVRRLMRPRPAREIAAGATVDPDDVAEAEALIGFVVTCRTYAGELAVNEVTQRTFSDLQSTLDTGTQSLLDALRQASDAERPFRQSQADAAVRFCGKVFGAEYAALLAKAADVACHSAERKQARA